MSYGLFTLALLLALAMVLTFNNWADVPDEERIVLLFLGLLPLLNAIFDYGSYALTFTLLRRGVLKPTTAWAWGIVDLIAACGIFFVSGTAMVIAVAGANWLAGAPLYPLDALFDGIRNDPSDYLWLYAMLFSTILPTALHASVGLFSIGAVLTPDMRRGLHRMIPRDDSVPATLAPLLIGLYWTACLLAPCALAYGIYWAIAQVYEHPLGWYLTWLEAVAQWIPRP